VAWSPAPAAAHPTTSFTACAAFSATGTRCYDGTPGAAAYIYGDTVFLRGRVRPVHDQGRAQIWRALPGHRTYLQVGTAPINARGNIRWNWRTTRADAYQGQPYHFRIRIKNHGRSNPVRLYVLFGE
jgi:hypothetical protein